MPDALWEAMHKADHWTHLGWAAAWAEAAKLLDPVDPAAARIAWGRAASSYEAYYDEYQKHLPASRFDYDWGPEAHDARQRANATPPPPAAPPPPLAAWIADALAGRYEAAVAAAPDAPEEPLARAVARALACACSAAGREDASQRLCPPLPPKA